MAKKQEVPKPENNPRQDARWTVVGISPQRQAVRNYLLGLAKDSLAQEEKSEYKHRPIKSSLYRDAA